MSVINSILILTYNRVAITRVCISQAISVTQTFDTEILIYDNYSTDGTLDFLETISAYSINNIRVFHGKKNIGMHAINFLAKKAKGKYIIKLDSDIIPPKNYVKRLNDAYMQVPNLAYLSWDIPWGKTSFAKRSGMKMYKKENGAITNLENGDRVLISHHPSRWMVNGALRFSEKEVFLKLGGHPPNKIYGVDAQVSAAAEQGGYYCGFLDSLDKAIHVTEADLENYCDKTSTT